VLVIGAFSLIAGYLCGREPSDVPGGAVAGAVNMSVGFGTILLVFGLFDRHFIAIGGRGLILYLLLMVVIGFGLGALAGLLRQRTVVRKRSES
jgi:hypothetical protein